MTEDAHVALSRCTSRREEDVCSLEPCSVGVLSFSRNKHAYCLIVCMILLVVLVMYRRKGNKHTILFTGFRGRFN